MRLENLSSSTPNLENSTPCASKYVTPLVSDNFHTVSPWGTWYPKILLAPKQNQSLYSVFQSLSCVQPFATPQIAACQASLSFTIFQSLLNGEGDGTPLQYSCLENPLDGGAWKAAVHGVTERQSLSLFTFMHWRRKWQPTPVFLPGESQGHGSLVGCHLRGHTESDTTEVT